MRRILHISNEQAWEFTKDEAMRWIERDLRGRRMSVLIGEKPTAACVAKGWGPEIEELIRLVIAERSL